MYSSFSSTLRAGTVLFIYLFLFLSDRLVDLNHWVPYFNFSTLLSYIYTNPPKNKNKVFSKSKIDLFVVLTTNIHRYG